MWASDVTRGIRQGRDGIRAAKGQVQREGGEGEGEAPEERTGQTVRWEEPRELGEGAQVSLSRSRRDLN